MAYMTPIYFLNIRLNISLAMHHSPDGDLRFFGIVARILQDNS